MYVFDDGLVAQSHQNDVQHGQRSSLLSYRSRDRSPPSPHYTEINFDLNRLIIEMRCESCSYLWQSKKGSQHRGHDEVCV